MSYLKGLADKISNSDAKVNFDLLEIDINYLVPSKNNFYGLRELDELAESIKTNGLMHNLVVRKIEDKYEIVSGHRRFYAMKQLDFKKIPCKVQALNDLDSEILLIQANSQQRELTPIEKMKGIERLTELYRQKKANGEEIPKGKIRDLVGKETGMSGTQVGRYTKVSKNLIEPLKDKLGEVNSSFEQATILSGLKEDEQRAMFNTIKDLDIKESRQEIDILIQGIKQPVESKRDKEFIREIYKEEVKHQESKNEIVNDDELEIYKELKEDPRPKIVISNEFIEFINYTQEVKLKDSYIKATPSGFSKTNYIKIKVISLEKVNELALLNNKVLMPERAYEVAPGVYLWFARRRE